MWYHQEKKDTHGLLSLGLQQLFRYGKHLFSDGCAWPWAATIDKWLHINSRNNEHFVVGRVSPPLARIICWTHPIRLSIKDEHPLARVYLQPSSMVPH